MAADYVTRRVGVLKEHLGIEEKKPDTIAREDEALRLFRQEAAARKSGMTGSGTQGWDVPPGDRRPARTQ